VREAAYTLGLIRQNKPMASSSHRFSGAIQNHPCGHNNLPWTLKSVEKERGTKMSISNEDILSRRKTLARIAMLAIGAYAAPALTTLSVAKAGGSGSSGGGDSGGDSSGSSSSSSSSSPSSASDSETDGSNSSTCSGPDDDDAGCAAAAPAP
jgi:hypothetical protein